MVAGDSADPGNDQVISGTDYQETLTSFPLGSQILTGLFLSITLTGADGTATTSTKTLADRLGPDVRLNGGKPALSFDPSRPSLVNPLDLTTIGVAPGIMNSALFNSYQQDLHRLAAQLDAYQASVPESPPTSPTDLSSQASAALSLPLSIDIQMAIILAFPP